MRKALVIFLLFCAPFVYADTTTVHVTKVTQSAVDGGGDISFDNTVNAQVEDGVFATGAPSGVVATIYGDHFAFTVPGGAIIDSIYFRVKIKLSISDAGARIGSMTSYPIGFTVGVDLAVSTSLGWVSVGLSKAEFETGTGKPLDAGRVNNSVFGYNVSCLDDNITGSVFSVDVMAISLVYRVIGGDSTASVLFAGTASTQANMGFGAWVNPANVTTENGVSATSTMTANPNQPTDYLLSSGYGFAVPSNATITGIEVAWKASEIKGDGAFGANLTQVVAKPTGSYIYTPETGFNITSVSATLTYYTAGSSFDLWNTTWTPAEINSSEFGFYVLFQAGGTLTGGVYSVDAMKITVYYTTPTAEASSGVRRRVSKCCGE